MFGQKSREVENDEPIAVELSVFWSLPNKEYVPVIVNEATGRGTTVTETCIDCNGLRCSSEGTMIQSPPKKFNHLGALAVLQLLTRGDALSFEGRLSTIQACGETQKMCQPSKKQTRFLGEVNKRIPVSFWTTNWDVTKNEWHDLLLTLWILRENRWNSAMRDPNVWFEYWSIARDVNRHKIVWRWAIESSSSAEKTLLSGTTGESYCQEEREVARCQSRGDAAVDVDM